MNNIILEEVDKIIDIYKNFLASEYLKKCFSLDFISKNKDEWRLNHEYLHEFDRFAQTGNEISLPSLIDLDKHFLALEKGEILYPVELSNILELLNCSEYLYDLLSDKKEFYHLNDDALDLNPLINLKREIESDVESDMTISSRASSKLKEIREKLTDINRELSSVMNVYKRRYSRYLSDDLITLKGGEEVLPVKNGNQGYIKGSIVSYSASGETVYMVPYEVIDLRNKQKRLIEEEADEVMRILADLSQKCSKQLKFLKRDYEIYLTFDRFFAAYRFGISYDGQISEESDHIELKSFFHPLLKAKNIVTNSLALGADSPRALLISGPNAGGKSVLIKAIAISVYLDRLGLFTPAKDGAKLPFIDKVYFLGGDNQSVLDNLSTFSSHILSIKNITEEATSDSLVIIDEVCEGTSPRDGEALGVAILNYFIKIGSYTILTSHFDALKFYAASNTNVLTGAMEFDNNGLVPTYHLLLHTTGKSYGLVLAKSIGLNQNIINDAYSFQAKRSHRDVDTLMEKLTEQESQNEKRARNLENTKKNLERIIQKKEAAIKALNEEKANIKNKAQEKVQRLVEQRIEEINQIWKSKNNSELHFNEVSEMKGKLKNISNFTATAEKKVFISDLKVGDLVEDEDGHRGVVKEIRKKEVYIDMDGLRFLRPIAGLKRAVKTVKDLKAEGKIKDVTTKLNLLPSRGMELNIIGLHVDEAMQEVVSFIGNASLRKLPSVRIIHGTGTFALKNALWKYLNNHKELIKDYRLGGEGEGGLGATIIHLK